MAFDFGSLEPRIHEILSAPGTDLATISAKRVRRQLLELDTSLTPEFLRENKEEVDAVIAVVFEKVSGGQGADAASDGMEQATVEETISRKRKQEDEDEAPDEEEDDDDIARQSPPPKKPKKSVKNGRELSDAELARKLSSEINGRSTRTGSKGRSGSAGKKAARTKKSAATVDSDDSDDSTKKRTRKQTSGGAKGGFGKEFALSDPLASVLNIDKLSRPQVVKQLWIYIKENQLQNPENKREILCDTSLRAVFGVDKIDMFKMNKVLGQHLHEIE
ncbi:hypothetical protein CPB84DRAFT_1812324 [Gymnopilus junonius]|uniref:DM2 domain-containing protein n=1 Tax=Gymnopilus junonius TaxID=109634 RepID=A0A9P5TSX8_GYMJU|nr:hypothetical protein CPB84DRAFT_1812324 [Gymnopilus junonius]